MESVKLLEKCSVESTLLRTQTFEWHKAFSDGHEVIENLPHTSPPSNTSANEENIEQVIEAVID